MSTLITKTEFEKKQWRRQTDYSFAKNDAIAPLVLPEIPKAALFLPVGFAMFAESYRPVALLGIFPGQNLHCTAEGKWLRGYIPAVYRGYPFSLAEDENGQLHLCIDESSGLVSDSDGEPFFTDEGGLTDAVKNIYNFLEQLHNNRQVTEQICATLQQFELIEPWPITLEKSDDEKPGQDLFRINETRLNSLDDESFAKIRKVGALPLIYCQLFSMQHLPYLMKLAEKQSGGKADVNEDSLIINHEALGRIKFGSH